VSRGRRLAAAGAGAALVAALALAAVLAATRSAPAVAQPIAFSHRSHVEGEELECTECHVGAEEGVHAGLPGIRECAECHRRAKGEHPDEPAVREYAKKGEQIPFVQINRNAGHVYFSHRVHVKLAGMECQECHGDVVELGDALQVPVAALASMKACMACHQQRGASNECAACHQ
jgi:c(7)-type cytochrome triheme protein